MDTTKEAKPEVITAESKMSEFGRVLYTFMLARGMEYKRDLARSLTAGGYRLSNSMLSMYLNGQRRVPWVFVRCVEELLKLSAAEKRALEQAHMKEHIDAHKALTDEQESIVNAFRG